MRSPLPEHNTLPWLHPSMTVSSSTVVIQAQPKDSMIAGGLKSPTTLGLASQVTKLLDKINSLRSTHPHPELTPVLATTMVDSTFMVVMVVLTMLALLSVTFTPSILRLRPGPSMSPLLLKPPTPRVVAVTRSLPTTTSYTHTVAGTQKPNTTTLLSLTLIPMNGATPISTMMFHAGTTPLSWLKLFPPGSTLSSEVRALTLMRVKPVLLALMSTQHATWILVPCNGLTLSQRTLRPQLLVSMQVSAMILQIPV